MFYLPPIQSHILVYMYTTDKLDYPFRWEKSTFVSDIKCKHYFAERIFLCKIIIIIIILIPPRNTYKFWKKTDLWSIAEGVLVETVLVQRAALSL